MLVIEKALYQEIIAHARAGSPQEVCGILGGRENRVEKVFKMTNTADSPVTCYFMDPREQFKTMKTLRAAGLEMLAIYHSHTGSAAYPSARDLELAFYPEAYYVIISLQDKVKPEVRAFKIVAGKIGAEEIEIK